MEFIDPVEMEHLLASAKITSMSDIISFVCNNVSKISMKNYEHLEERICELEKPKGLDRIMIQEVKTLVEAMIDQREQYIKRELQRNHRDNIASSFQLNEPSRRSLNEIDFTNIINIQQGNQSQQLKRGSMHYIPVSQICNPKTDVFIGEVRDLRELMSSKPERRQLQELRKTLNNLSKQVISKVTFEETEKLMIKFQKQIFLKLKEGRSDLEQIESKLQKAVQAEIQSFKQEAQDLSKSKLVNAKLQKKVKKYLQEMAYVRSDLQKMQKGLSNMKNQCQKKHLNQIKNMENLQKLVQELEYEKKTVNENSLAAKNTPTLASLFFSRPISHKNNAIVWQNEIYNTLPDYIEFDAGKTQIRIVYPGIYEVCCLLYGNGNSKKPPTLLYNSETLAKFEAINTSNDLLPKWKFREWVNVKHQKVNLSVKYQNQDSVCCVLLYISRVLS